MGKNSTEGFTLIELSIVLVIIGLIVGGVLVGQDLIKAAEVRATISQIERYNTAVNTFYGKYDAIPGDMNATTAATFGFSTVGRVGNASPCSPLDDYIGPCGNGNGILENAEQIMFWVDLSSPVAGGLIDGSFTAGTGYQVQPAAITQAGGGGLPADPYLPAAKLGRGNYIFAWEGGWSNIENIGDNGDGSNYFSLATPPIAGPVAPPLTVTVSQAYNIDKKMDDGMPQSGNVMADYNDGKGPYWAAGGGYASGDYSSTTNGPVTSAGDIGDGMAAGPLSCYDGSKGLPEQYSLQINGGAGPNCALSFKFQ